MGQQVYHINSIIEPPKFQNGNIVSVMCIYCYEDILFDIPESRLKLGHFPIQLVSRHGDPAHDLSIEVFENREIKILRKESEQKGPLSHLEQDAKPSRPLEDSPRSVIIPGEQALPNIPPIETSRPPEPHSYPHRDPVISEKAPPIPSFTQEMQQASTNFREGDQSKPKQLNPPLTAEGIKSLPQVTLFEGKKIIDPGIRIQTLMQQLPSLSQDEIAEELMQIAFTIADRPSRYKIISEIKNWARDLTRMRWDDKQINFLSHQLKFWIDKLDQSQEVE